MVLTDKFLFTFKQKRTYKSPTERILIQNIEQPRCSDRQLRKADTISISDLFRKQVFYFRAEDPFEKHKFIGAVQFMMMLNSAKLSMTDTDRI